MLDRWTSRARLARVIAGLRCEAVWCRVLVDRPHGYCSATCAQRDVWRRSSWQGVAVNAPVAPAVAVHR